MEEYNFDTIKDIIKVILPLISQEYSSDFQKLLRGDFQNIETPLLAIALTSLGVWDKFEAISRKERRSKTSLVLETASYVIMILISRWRVFEFAVLIVQNVILGYLGTDKSRKKERKKSREEKSREEKKSKEKKKFKTQSRRRKGRNTLVQIPSWTALAAIAAATTTILLIISPTARKYFPWRRQAKRRWRSFTKLFCRTWSTAYLFSHVASILYILSNFIGTNKNTGYATNWRALKNVLLSVPAILDFDWARAAISILQRL